MSDYTEIQLLVQSDDSDERKNATYKITSKFKNFADTDKGQAWKDLLALMKDENHLVTLDAGSCIYFIFTHVVDKKKAWKDLLTLMNDDSGFVRDVAADTISSVFSQVTDKERALNELLPLIKNPVSSWNVQYIFNIILFNDTNQEQKWKNDIIKDLLVLTKDEQRFVRITTRFCLIDFARFYLKMRDYRKTFKCLDGVASTYKYTLKEHIKPNTSFFYYMGFSSYYHGRAVINELFHSENPEEYFKNVKYAVVLFAKSIKYIEKSTHTDEAETLFFPICLNIFSAYYEYYVSLQKLDKKRVAKVQKYLDEASKQCNIISTKKGFPVVVTGFEKLVITLTSRLNEIELEIEKSKVYGMERKTRYVPFINKSRKDFQKHIDELENFLDEIDAPIIKKILEFEMRHLEKLNIEKGERPYSKSFLEKSRDFIVQKWKIIVAISAALAGFLGFLTTIIEKWEIISELIKNLM